MIELTEAVLQVMSEVKGIDKTMQVGSGKMQYKGVPDQAVKQIIGESMRKNGLVMLPIKIEPTTRVDRWEQTDQWGTKQKQSVFTEVVVTYKLMHKSGESMEISGYGHGADSQDKGAGKATTYALKYALLYAFLVPTGKIDDSDSTHSNENEVPLKDVKKVIPVNTKAVLEKDRFDNALLEIEKGNYDGVSMRATFELNKTQEKILVKLENKLKENGEDNK